MCNSSDAITVFSLISLILLRTSSLSKPMSSGLRMNFVYTIEPMNVRTTRRPMSNNNQAGNPGE